MTSKKLKKLLKELDLTPEEKYNRSRREMIEMNFAWAGFHIGITIICFLFIYDFIS